MLLFQDGPKESVCMKKNGDIFSTTLFQDTCMTCAVNLDLKQAHVTFVEKSTAVRQTGMFSSLNQDIPETVI